MSMVANLEIPDGGVAQGTQVRLADGTYLNGLTAVKLEIDPKTSLWRMEVGLNPRFIQQVPIELEIHAVNIGNIADLTDDQLAHLGLQRIPGIAQN